LIENGYIRYAGIVGVQLASERRLGYRYTSEHRSDWRDHFSAVSRRPRTAPYPRAVCGTRVVVDLLDDRTVALASREDAIQPANAKRSDVKRILRAAAEHFDVLVAAWEKMHP
jgi:hypothetical protein